jgi:hypothetical protein
VSKDVQSFISMEMRPLMSRLCFASSLAVGGECVLFVYSRDHVHSRDFRLYKPQEVVSFDTLRAFLHMSAKYDIAALRVDALSRLRAKFPSAESASSYNYIRQDEGLPWRIDSYPGIEYDLANLAREHRIWDVLPVLYLRVLTHDGYEWEHVLDGFPAPKQSSQAPNVRKLSLDNRRAVLLGERRLTHHQSACIAAWISPTCTGGRACRDALALKRLAHMDPRFFLVFWGAWRAGLEARLCEHCRSHARGQYTVQQDQTWRDLPEFFDLPSWDVLISCTEANAELPTSVENV